MPILVVANSKGGSGKTTAAVNILRRIKFDKIIDADIHRGLSNVLSLNAKYQEVKVAESPAQVEKWCERNKWVLIDCGGFDSDITRTAISLADMIITPSNDDVTEQFGLINFNDVLSDISGRIDKDMIAKVLISKVHHSRKRFPIIEGICDSLSNIEMLPFVIPHSTKVTEAIGNAEAAKDCKAAVAFDQLCELIKEEIANG